MAVQNLKSTSSKVEDAKKRHKKNITKKASELFEESKKLANDYYEEGVEKAHGTQESFKEYGDELVTKVREKPLTSLLIAGGVGFLLSALLKK